MKLLILLMLFSASSVLSSGIKLPVVEEPINCEPGRYYFIPYGDNCTMYVLCNFGTPVIFSCATGTLYDPEIEKCVRGENYDCPELPTTTAPPVPEPTTERQFPCTDHPFIYIQHPEECSLFYLCKSGQFHGIISCGLQHWFDSAFQGCVKPEVSDCPHGNPPTSTTTESTIPLTCPDHPYIYVQHPEDCSLFYHCKNGEFQGIYSCGTTNWFDSAFQGCVKPEVSDCPHGNPLTSTTTESTIPLTCPDHPYIYVQHPEDCSLFYHCKNGEFQGIYSCGTTNWFDSIFQGCVKPEDSDCKHGL